MQIQFAKWGKKGKVLKEEELAYLNEFLERPDITYTNLGIKDNVYEGMINGEKTVL